MYEDFRFSEEGIRKGFKNKLDGSDLIQMQDFHLHGYKEERLISYVTNALDETLTALTPEERGEQLAIVTIKLCLEEGYTHIFPDIMVSQYVNYGDDFDTKHFGKRLLLHIYIVLEVATLEEG